MTRIKRPAAAAVAAVLLGFSLTACGDDAPGLGGGAPDDASEEEFCEVALESPEEVDAVNEWGEDLEDVGTPEDIPDEAREGFELLVDLAKDVDQEDLDNEDFFDDLSGEEQDQFTAYSTYLGETCTPDVPTEDLTESE